MERLNAADSIQYIYDNTPDAEKNFLDKAFVKKIIVLCSLTVNNNNWLKHKFVWIYSNKTIDNLIDILDVNVNKEDPFLVKNHAVYEAAKKIVGFNDNSLDGHNKLYQFLWDLAEGNMSDLMDFNSNSLMFSGAPGTGKTFGVRKGIEKLQNINSKYRDMRYVQFHPVFSYQDFIEGIKPMGITSGGNIDLKVVNGVFKKFCIYVREQNEIYYSVLQKKPQTDNDNIDPNEFKDWPHYYFIVDEINRGNLSNIFGETFSLLESDYRDYDFSGNYKTVDKSLVSTPLSNVIASITENDENSDLVYKKINGEVYFGIPFNIHFIGIMNEVDRSIDAFDLALRRRFKWNYKYCDYGIISKVLIAAKFDYDSVSNYVRACEALNNHICEDGLNLGKTYEIGHAFFLKIRHFKKQTTIAKIYVGKVFDNYIAGTVKEYARLVAEENEVEGKVKKAKKAFINAFKSEDQETPDDDFE